MPDRLKYHENLEMREEIVYTTGGDPTRYNGGDKRRLKKSDARRIAQQLQPEENDLELHDMKLREILENICKWAGGEYNRGSATMDITRDNLKLIHQALDAKPPQEVAVGGHDGH